jgi:hypothetical protein
MNDSDESIKVTGVETPFWQGETYFSKALFVMLQLVSLLRFL